LHHRITARIVNVSSSERASIRFEEKCAVYFQNGPARESAVVDKSPLNFGGLLLLKPCLIPVALSGTGASGSYQSKTVKIMHGDVVGSERAWPLSYGSIEAIVCAVDVLLIILVSVTTGTSYAQFNQGDVDLARYVSTAILASVVFVALFRRRCLYDPSSLVNWSLQARNIATLWTVTFLILAGVAFALKIGKDFSRGAVLLFAIAGPAVLIIHHSLWRAVIKAGRRRGRFRGCKSILICMHESADAAPITRGHTQHLELHGFKIDRTYQLSEDILPQELIEQVVEFARGSEVEEIFVAADLRRWPEIPNLVRPLAELPLPLTFLPDEVSAALFTMTSRQFGSLVGVEFQRGPLSLSDRVVKRLLDIVLGVSGIVLLTPMFVIIAIAIKLDSPGHALFRQTRRGFNSRKFKIFKFRTMTDLEDDTTIRQAVRGDRRVTGIGAWLRRTSIDELPQLFNVVKGDMSLVGPRPHAAAHDDYYAEQISHYALRHHMKPGITGWAQIRGYRGETPTVQSMKERVEHDIWYIDNWSVTLDVQIILLTALEVIRGRNAY
jgi:Undecaprenyl-phosphate glucose phosphotransferase